jgi:hypothetical protein
MSSEFFTGGCGCSGMSGGYEGGAEDCGFWDGVGITSKDLWADPILTGSKIAVGLFVVISIIIIMLVAFGNESINMKDYGISMVAIAGFALVVGLVKLGWNRWGRSSSPLDAMMPSAEMPGDVVPNPGPGYMPQ